MNCKQDVWKADVSRWSVLVRCFMPVPLNINTDAQNTPVVRFLTETQLNVPFRVIHLATRRTVRGPKAFGDERFSFYIPAQPGLGPTQPPLQWVPRHFPGGKAVWTWR
jgi:hypothetical protein